ncbi:MAG: hypothetical protein AAGC60_14405 [Acidobacteriota bacterium]
MKLTDPRGIEAFGALLPFLDGSREADEILSTLEARGIDPGIVRAVLDHLETNSLLEEAEAPSLMSEHRERFASQIRFFSRYAADGGHAYQDMLATTRVAVIGSGRLAQSMLASLSNAGFEALVHLTDGETEPDAEDSATSSWQSLVLDRRSIWPASGDLEPPDLFVLALESHDPQLAEAMDAFARDRGVRWLLLRLFDRHQGWVGPLFIPGETASYLSLEARFRANIPFYDEYAAYDRHVRDRDDAPPSIGGLHAFVDLLANAATIELVKLVTGIDTPRLAGRFLTIDLFRWDFDMHEVLRMPRLDRGTGTGPSHFPWKEIPYGDTQQRRS